VFPARGSCTRSAEEAADIAEGDDDRDAIAEKMHRIFDDHQTIGRD
jgi:hypothetical protein